MTRTQFALLAGVAVAGGLAAALLVAPMFQAQAQSPDSMRAVWAHNYGSLGQMARDADAVVVARVEDTRPGRSVPRSDGSEPLPFTLAELRVQTVVRGRSPEVITVEQTGGDVEGRIFHVDGDGGLYAPGQSVLLFLKKQPDTGYYYLSSPQGRFDVVRGKVKAVSPDDPVSQSLDLQTVRNAVGHIRSAR